MVVDEYLRSSQPNVVAAGDCAAWWSGRYDCRLRVEHWDTALHAPDVAAGSLLDADGPAYDPVPYFWSDQFGHNLQFAGHLNGSERVVVRGDTINADWAVGWFDDSGSQLIAILTVDRPRDLTQARRVMTANAKVDPELFADPATPVKNAVLP